MPDWFNREEIHFAPERRFQLAEEAARKLLVPGEIINRDAQDAIGFGHVLIVGNSNLNIDSLRLRGRDYQSIGNLAYPGKSGVLDFVGASTSGKASKSERNVVTTRTFGKETDRHDSLYMASIPAINNAGFEVFYAPVRTNLIHVRIVHRDALNLQYPLMSEFNLREDDLTRLKESFIKIETS